MATKIYPINHKIEESTAAYKLDYKNLKLSFYNGMSAMLIDARARLDYLKYTVALMSKEFWENRETMPERDSSELSDAIWNAEQMIESLEDFIKTMEALS